MLTFFGCSFFVSAKKKNKQHKICISVALKYCKQWFSQKSKEILHDVSVCQSSKFYVYKLHGRNQIIKGTGWSFPSSVAEQTSQEAFRNSSRPTGLNIEHNWKLWIQFMKNKQYMKDEGEWNKKLYVGNFGCLAKYFLMTIFRCKKSTQRINSFHTEFAVYWCL